MYIFSCFENREMKAVMLAHLFVDKTVQDGHQQPLKRTKQADHHMRSNTKTPILYSKLR